MSDEYFTPQHVAGTRAGVEGYQAMSEPLVGRWTVEQITELQAELMRFASSAQRCPHTHTRDWYVRVSDALGSQGFDNVDADAALAEVRAEVSRLEAIKTPDASFTYCAYCGEKSPVDDHNEDLSAHIKTCPKHPMRDVEQQLAEVTKQRDDQMARKDALLADRSKDCKLAHANECMTGCQYRTLEQTIGVHADVLAETIHKHEQQHAEIGASHASMLKHFTAMRRAAGGHDDTMQEAVERVSALKQQLAVKDQRLAVVEEALKEQRRQLHYPGLPAAFTLTMKRLLDAALAGAEVEL